MKLDIDLDSDDEADISISVHNPSLVLRVVVRLIVAVGGSIGFIALL